MTIGAELGQHFVQTYIQKKSEDFSGGGLNPLISDKRNLQTIANKITATV